MSNPAPHWWGIPVEPSLSIQEMAGVPPTTLSQDAFAIFVQRQRTLHH